MTGVAELVVDVDEVLDVLLVLVVVWFEEALAEEEDEFPLVVVESVVVFPDFTVGDVEFEVDSEVEVEAVLLELSSVLFEDNSAEELADVAELVVLVSVLESVEPDDTTESEPPVAAGDLES